MKKIIGVLAVLNFTCFFSFGQCDIQKSILTDKGVFTVSQTDEGDDVIILNSELWNEMVNGTKYTADNLPGKFPTKVFIRISSKDSMHCATGIGFSCGIFDRETGSAGKPAIVNKENRFAAAILEPDGINAVKIIFSDKVDWDSLR